MPLAIENGTGSELRRPLGVSIVGGLLVSQVLTLYTTPVIYLYMDRLGRWVQSWRAKHRGLTPAPPSLPGGAGGPRAARAAHVAYWHQWPDQYDLVIQKWDEFLNA